MLIGFCGYARAGKDTAADTLGGGWKRLAFADGVRDAATRANPFFEEVNMTYVELLEKLGYEAAKRKYPFIREYIIKVAEDAKKINPMVWVDATMAAAIGYDRVVITDVRHQNEAAAIVAAGGIVYKIIRLNNQPFNEVERNSVDSICVEIIINDDLKDFRAKIAALGAKKTLSAF